MICVKPDVVFTMTLLVASLSSNLAGATEDGLRLELASVVFRHGDRSPVATFPNDNYTESDWPQGFGQLSTVGMQQQFHLGELLKARYIVDDGCKGLVCSDYTRVQVRVRSTDIDRTLMSVEAQLSALFPPGPTQNFSSSLLWQPIPVHTVPAYEDKMLVVPPIKGTCAFYDKLREKILDLPEYKKMETKYKDFLEDIGQKSGVQNLSLAGVNRLTDTIFIESVSKGYHPPDWVNSSVLATMTLISDFTLSLLFNTKEKNRLTAGVWLEKLLLDMKTKSNLNGNQSVDDMKLFLYSAHDTTVAAMTSALQVYNNMQPGYASAFAVELYSNANNSFFVKMFRRDGPDSETFDLLNVKYCKDSDLCTLEEFESFVMPLIPDDLAMECGNMPTTQPPNVKKQWSFETIVIILGCLLCVALTIIVIIAVVLLSSKLKKRRRAQRIFSALIQETDS